MSSVIELFRSWSSPRAITLALVAVGAAGCSADSSRFNDGPYASRNTQGEYTGSIAPGQAAPVGRVETQPLPQYNARPAYNAQPPVGSAGGGRGSASYSGPTAYNQPQAYNQPSAYQPPASNQTPAYGQQQAYNPPPPPNQPAAYSRAAAPEITGTVTAPNSVVRKPAPAGQWTWDGGTAITVASGDTVDGIARRHNVPPSAIMQANNLASANAIQPGQRLVIPRYISGGTAVAAAQPVNRLPSPAPKPAPSTNGIAAGPINPGVHIVAPGETLTKIAHQYGKSLVDVAKANNIPPYTKVNIGDRIVIPGYRGGRTASAVDQAPAPVQLPSKPAPANKEIASVAPSQSASVVTPAVETPAPVSPVKAAATDTTPTFRWPVRGRIIAGFGPKPSGQQNDGINVSVPENTPIKAAEDGVVAYAGDELKGYGNLVLVRHPNGYVTAYAHAKELLVKRGDTIKRGQVIAKSGQTGGVDAPQLHFEIRKGSSPVDPMQFLNGA